MYLLCVYIYLLSPKGNEAALFSGLLSYSLCIVTYILTLYPKQIMYVSQDHINYNPNSNEVRVLCKM